MYLVLLKVKLQELYEQYVYRTPEPAYPPPPDRRRDRGEHYHAPTLRRQYRRRTP